MKLDNKYQHTRSMILMRKKMPTPAEAYNILTQEQTHQDFSKNTMFEQQEVPIACRAKKRRTFDNKNKGKGDYKNKKQNIQLFCEHCKTHGHTMDKCWKIHYYPSSFKSNTWKKDEGAANKSYMASTDSINQGSNMVEQNSPKNNIGRSYNF